MWGEAIIKKSVQTIQFARILFFSYSGRLARVPNDDRGFSWQSLPMCYFASAITSISTSAPLGNVLTATAERAG